ncbi:MAG TPA: SAM-dependent methyltransferase [Verrucomicrobiota bacterium]|nr:methyltransferase [Verrucomicrobiales bacterium]HRI15926.1 SAM-dependent methyltransferase [Verrucomicrobiota bacterium]
MAIDARGRWLTLADEALRSGAFVRLSLAAPGSGEPDLRRVRLRPVTLQSGLLTQWVWEFATRDVTKNLNLEETLIRLRDLVGTSFRTAHLVTTGQTAELDLRHKPKLKVSAVSTPPADGAHDRGKTRIVDQYRPWLHSLGVTTTDGRVCRGMEPKFRQIHRFVELLEPLVEAAGIVGSSPASDGSDALHLVDMGCGKGYLTFAAHEHLRTTTGRPVRTLGVEARAELVAATNGIAVASGCTGLEFVAGAIAGTPIPRTDILVALHACDTATDDALAVGIAAGASLLVVAPCCHREIRPQLVAPPVLAETLRQGIFRERHAEFVTDALRAALLETAGYETRVFEFISPEHTAKNLMIAAVKRAHSDRDKCLQRVRELARFYGIRRQQLAHRLEISLEEPDIT